MLRRDLIAGTMSRVVTASAGEAGGGAVGRREVLRERLAGDDEFVLIGIASIADLASPPLLEPDARSAGIPRPRSASAFW